MAIDMDVNSHKLQLMKASFFADDDYDDRSEISVASESRVRTKKGKRQSKYTKLISETL